MHLPLRKHFLLVSHINSNLICPTGSDYAKFKLFFCSTRIAHHAPECMVASCDTAIAPPPALLSWFMMIMALTSCLGFITALAWKRWQRAQPRAWFRRRNPFRPLEEGDESQGGQEGQQEGQQEQAQGAAKEDEKEGEQQQQQEDEPASGAKRKLPVPKSQKEKPKKEKEQKEQKECLLSSEEFNDIPGAASKYV